MGDLGDYWRDVKQHYRHKKNKFENKIYPLYKQLTNHPETIEVGDHHRLRGWDFWYTGTVYNNKTQEYLSLKELAKLVNL